MNLHIGKRALHNYIAVYKRALHTYIPVYKIHFDLKLVLLLPSTMTFPYIKVSFSSHTFVLVADI